MIPGGLVLLQPLFWLSLSLLTLGSVIGVYPGYQLQGWVRKVKNKRRVAYKTLAKVTDSRVQNHSGTEPLLNQDTPLPIPTSRKSLGNRPAQNHPLVQVLSRVFQTRFSWPMVMFLRLFFLVVLILVGLMAFQTQRQFHSLYGIPFLRNTQPTHGGELLVQWLNDLSGLPSFLYFTGTLLLVGFVWALSGLTFRLFTLLTYLATLVLVIQAMGTISLGDGLKLDYLGITPEPSIVLVSLDQPLLQVEQSKEFGRVYFEGFQLPYWGISFGLPSIVVRSYRIDFGEPTLSIQDQVTPDQSQSSLDITPSPPNSPRRILLQEASFPRPLVGSISNFGLDVIELFKSLYLSNPFARRSGFLSPFNHPDGIVIFDRGLFTLVLTPRIR